MLLDQERDKREVLSRDPATILDHQQDIDQDLDVRSFVYQVIGLILTCIFVNIFIFYQHQVLDPDQEKE